MTGQLLPPGEQWPRRHGRRRVYRRRGGRSTLHSSSSFGMGPSPQDDPNKCRQEQDPGGIAAARACDMVHPGFGFLVVAMIGKGPQHVVIVTAFFGLMIGGQFFQCALHLMCHLLDQGSSLVQDLFQFILLVLVILCTNVLFQVESVGTKQEGGFGPPRGNGRRSRSAVRIPPLHEHIIVAVVLLFLLGGTCSLLFLIAAVS